MYGLLTLLVLRYAIFKFHNSTVTRRLRCAQHHYVVESIVCHQWQVATDQAGSYTRRLRDFAG